MGRRDENKALKLRRLEQAGLRAFIAHGYAAASIEQIVAEAGVARGTFYLYFRSKDHLFVSLIDRLVNPLVAVVKETRDALALCTDSESTFPVYAMLGMRIAEVLRDEASLVRLYLSESRSAGRGGATVRRRSVRLERLTKEILDDAVGRGLLRPHDTHMATHAILGAIERIALQILRGDRAMVIDRVAVEIVLVFRQGLALS